MANATPVTRLIARTECLKVVCAMAFVVLAWPAFSQVYQVGSGGTVKPQAQPGQKQTSGQQLGWGSNIQSARLARAAQQALDRGDHPLALEYAQRAAQSAPSDPQLWFLVGYTARLDGRYGQSLNAYQKGLQISPGSADGESGLAQTYSLMGRTSDAEHLLQQLLATNPARRNDQLLLGNLYLQSGDYNDALQSLTTADRFASDARSELLLALCYEHLHQMDRANHYLQLARSRAPNNPDVERSLAGYYRQSGDYAKAVDELQAIPNPRPDVVAELAYTDGLAGRMSDSAQLYGKAADAEPHDAALQLSAAQAEVAAGAPDQAEPFLKRAAAIDPNYYRLHAIRGEIAEGQDHDEDAAREYSEAIAHLPSSPVEGPLYGIQLHMNLETLEEQLGASDAAHQQLQIAENEIGALNEQGSDRAAFLRLRAQVEMAAGQVPKALSDIHEALALTPNDPNGLQLDGDLLMKQGHIEDAIDAYKKVLTIDPHSRFALTSLGYASRAEGNDRAAEKYFDTLAKEYPSLYVPYLALGDLYTARHEYKRAQVDYAKGYAVAPQNALIVAGGMNAGIEAHDLPLAGQWLHRTTDAMQRTPQVLREEERYFSFEGQYQRSADLGRQAIQYLPHDRDVVVYLGYDLLRLGKYQELQALTNRYEDVLPHEPDIPLLAGYVYKHDGEKQKALQAFTETLRRDPSVVTAYVNRGFVLNDLHRPDQAAADFEQALQREPKDGEAHLGLAFADLNLQHAEAAIRQTELAEKYEGDSEALHLIRATAYGREGMLTRAADEYHAALRFDPGDGTLYLGLGGVLFAERRYHDAIDELEKAQTLQPRDAQVYALEARAWAGLQDRDAAMHDVELAEQFAAEMPATPSATGSPKSDIYVSTGEALSTLGDNQAAMERFSRALTTPNSNRVSVRLAVAQLMVQQGHSDSAQRQIALAQMEAAVGQTAPPTGNQYIEAADLFGQMHDYQLSETYLQHAQTAGAPDLSVRVAMANDDLAVGNTTQAATELAAASRDDGSQSDYSFLLAQANVYEQEHRSTQALSAFAQAAKAAGEDQTAERDLLQAGGNEGYRITPEFSALSNFVAQPIFEDSTVYVLDAKTFGNPPAIYGATTNLAELPPPRYSNEIDWTNAFHLHLGPLPPAGGFVQIRNARGQISVPAIGIVNRDTTDTNLNFGVDPTIRIGPNVLTFNTGIQGTIRRDALAPVQMNQNLFRVFTYLSTSSFFNAISANGYFIRETGPFTETPINEQTITGAFNFRVGAPWGRTALITGWGSNDQVFTSTKLGNSENYYTSSYAGLTHRFSSHLSMEGIAEDVRAWRVVPFNLQPSGQVIHSGTAQALRPAGTIDFAPALHWDIQISTAYENTRSFHLYDMTQNGISVSWVRPFGRTFNEETGAVHLKYPIRFSAGVQEETFFNFTQGRNQVFRPYVSINLF